MDKVITAIKVQKRNPQRVNIDLDGEFAFGLSRIVAAWLKTGDHLSDERISLMIEQDNVEVAYQRALNLLNHRSRSEKEIRLRLARNEFTPVQIDHVVEKLKLANLIEDGEFARMWVENRNEFHPRSKNLMRFELKNKGIGDEFIDDALEKSRSDTDLAYQAAVQYSHRLIGKDWETFRRRLSGFLARRGFSYGIAAPIINTLWQQEYAKENSNKEEEDFKK